jgi:hypothetical protein
MDRFAEIQQDTRQIKQKFNIAIGGTRAMARVTEELIAGTALRATRPHLLIDPPNPLARC